MQAGKRFDLILSGPFRRERAREIVRARNIARYAQHNSLQSSEGPFAIRRRQNQD